MFYIWLGSWLIPLIKLSIKVQYLTLDFKISIKTFEGFEAQIIQHEIDHLEGVLI